MQYLTAVSGMPRPGTSLMMQMLAAGGMPVVTDGRRAADEHNLKGYFEDERTRGLGRDTGWLREAGGKAVKIIYRLLRHLPADLEYRVLLLDRDPEEVFDSQQGMLASRLEAAIHQNREKMISAMKADLDATKAWIR